MGNAPPHGNSRDDPHQGQGGPYNMNDAAGVVGHHQNRQQQNQNQKQYPYHNHQQSQASSSSSQQQRQQQHQHHHHPYNPTNRTQMNYNNMPSSNSDASMSNVEDNNNNQRHPPSSSTESQQHQRRSSSKPNLNLSSLSASDDDAVPTVFRWEHGGRQVYITGTFNGWSRQIPMHRSGNDFTYIHNLKRGKHAFKFIVDDEWRFAPDQPTVADIEGRINNFIDVTDFKPYTGDKEFEREKAAAYYSQRRNSNSNMQMQQDGCSDKGGGAGGAVGGNAVANAPDTFTDPDGEVFTHNMPDLDEYTKDPPPLPPHLRHIILNKPPQLSDTAALPVPQHVALNHLYCTAIKDNMMVLGITQRFKTKFVTTVYYSPEG